MGLVSTLICGIKKEYILSVEMKSWEIYILYSLDVQTNDLGKQLVNNYTILK